jgi:hypothetical protein
MTGVSGRRYLYTGPIGRRPREHHELVVRDPLSGGAQADAPRYELDGRGITRETAAWVIGRWRRSRRGVGASLMHVRFGPGRPAWTGAPRGSVLWCGRLGDAEGGDLR